MCGKGQPDPMRNDVAFSVETPRILDKRKSEANESDRKREE
jgi:hypothetical protein